MNGTYSDVSDASKKLIDDALEAARVFSKRDRSILGRFVISERLLFLADAIYRLDLLDTYFLTRSRISALRAELIDITSSSDIDLYVVDAEVSFWYRAMVLLGSDQDNEHLDRRLDFLELVAGYDERYHDYFAVGILDIEETERALAEGIDAGLLLSVHHSV